MLPLECFFVVKQCEVIFQFLLKFHNEWLQFNFQLTTFMNWILFWLAYDGPFSLNPQATFECLLKTYGFLTPDFWRETRFVKSPYQEYTDLLTPKPINKAVITEVDQAEP